MLSLSRKNAFFAESFKRRNRDVIENLFVISNLGQLKHVSGLIDKMGFQNCCLVVLYTNANYHVPRLIHDEFSQSIFKYVIFLEIPRSPNSFNFEIAYRLQKDYRKALKNIKPRNIFLNSFDYHYAMLARLAKSLSIKVFLVEEGLGTYSLKTSGRLNQKLVHSLPNKEDIKKISKKTLGNSELFKKIYKTQREIVDFSRQAKGFILDLYKDKKTQQFLLAKYPSLIIQSYLNPMLDFDGTYTSFPNITETIFNSQNHYFYSSYEMCDDEQVKYANEVINHYKIKPYDYLYLSQHYQVNANEYVNVLYDFFVRFIDESESKIFVKLHPKQEREEVYQAFLEMEQKTKGRIVVIKESGFLIEEVIRQSKIKGVIGITSSALIYTSIVSKDTIAYSVAEILLKNMNGNSKDNKKGLKMIADHANILKQFKQVNFLK